MHRKPASMGACALLLLLSCVGNRAFGQACPSAGATGSTSPSQVQTLEGRLIFHDGIRQWFELKLDRPHCGQRSVELVQADERFRVLDVLRGCRVKSSGAIDFSGTGYFSLDTFQDVKKVEPVGTCPAKLPFADYSSVKPDKRVRAYRVDMHVIYRPGDYPVVFHVRSAGRELKPWQAYASYMLTGGFVLYGRCGDGFVVDKVFGTSAAHPGHFDDPRTSNDMASFDPEGAAQAGTSDLRLGYTCVRTQPGEH